MTTISNKVRLYRYSDANAPVLSGTAGALVSLLDACLVDGYDPKTINTLTVAGNNATAVISAGHSYEVGAVIRIAGATPAALNGDWRLASVTGTDAVFSVEGLGIAEGAATGTITALRAPVGWAKIYSDTNRAAYRSLDYASHNGMVLYVDDTGTTTARTRGYESMSDIDTGTGPFPTDAQSSGGLWWGKSDSASSSARRWALVADAKSMALATCAQGAYQNSANCPTFGALRDTHAADSYAHVISGATSSANATSWASGPANGLHVFNGNNANEGGVFLARTITGTGGSVAASVRVSASSTTTGVSSYPAATLATQMWAAEGTVFEGTGNAVIGRGTIRGPAHLYAYLSAAAAPGFDLIGVPGDGALFMRANINGQGFLMNLGRSGNWE